MIKYVVNLFAVCNNSMHLRQENIIMKWLHKLLARWNIFTRAQEASDETDAIHALSDALSEPGSIY